MLIIETKEFKRVYDLPRYDWRGEDQTDLLSSSLKTIEGTMQLWSIQSAALIQAYKNQGLLGALAVGAGKTLITALIPTIVSCERPLILVPAQLKYKTQQDFKGLSKHWQIRKDIRIHSYSELSIADKSNFLDKYKPDVIVCDECHKLKRRASARTRRFIQYFRKNPDTLFFGFSGTITKDSIMDYWHLVLMALKEGAPLPLFAHEALQWDEAIKPFKKKNDKKIHPGALLQFCNEGEKVRDGFRRRFVETPGIIATSKGALGTSLVISLISNIEVPSNIKFALKQLYNKWVTPDGQELEQIVDVLRVAKQLSMGFYYKWIWPNDIINKNWLEARSKWTKFVRHVLSLNYKGVDSPLQVARAIDSNHAKISNQGLNILNQWRAVKHEYTPKYKAVWLSRYIVDYIEQYQKQYLGIVWCEHKALGNELKNYYGEGVKEIPQKNESLALSIPAHGTGKNLQLWSNNLITSVPSSGQAIEQLIGRTHRPGQKADQVDVLILQHTKVLKDCYTKAKDEALYIEESTGQKQKLLYAKEIKLC